MNSPRECQPDTREVKPLTNEAMADLICSGVRPVQISMSKEGIFLTVGAERHEITEHQACILWDVMPQLAAIPATEPRP